MTTELLERPAEAPGQERESDDGMESEKSDVRQFVTFVAGDEVFAVDMAPRWTG